jgi:hypothetical protein
VKATLLVRSRIVYAEDEFAELVVWELRSHSAGSTHRYKYRLAFVARDVCVIRYDNEAGKGDHRHRNAREENYRFVSLDELFADFDRDIRSYHDEDRRS